MNKAVIMAGGFGTRLRPLTMTVPKPMVPLLNKPMMEHIVNLLKKYNINDIVSVLYFHPEIITDHFGDGSDFDIKMTYKMAQADYGTAGAVRNAAEHLKDRFIIISGDVLTDFDLQKAIDFHIEKKSKATLLLTRVEAPLQYGIVMTDDSGRVTRFLEKPSWGQVFSDTINTGIYILEREVLDLIPFQEEFDFSKDLFPLMLEKNMPLYGYISEGYWKDVGNLNEYQAGQYDSLSGKVNLNFGGEDLGKIRIDETAKIADSAKLDGVVLVGKNSTVGENAQITNCVIGDNVKIGNSAQLTGVTIWDNVEIGDLSELNQNVICNDTKIGTRVKIDENVFVAEKCKIGNDAVLNSNIKLWPNKIVEEGSILSSSLVQEEKWQRELFTDARITGLSNVEMNPEFAAKLGASLGLTLGENARLLASRDPDGASRITKRALTAGLASVGVNVNDLQTTSIPQTRQELQTGKYVGGIHVRKSPRNRDYTDIIIFSKDGRDIPIAKTKKIERYFFGEDIKRAHYSKVGKLFYPERTNEIYLNRYEESLELDLIRNKNFKLLMDYSYGLASNIFPKILGSMNTEVLSLHNYVDGSKYHPDPNEVQEDHDNTGKIMKSLGYELGFRLMAGAEKISMIDERGEWISHLRLLSKITKLFLETNRHREPYKIAVSIVATQEIEEIAADYNVEVVRIQNHHSAMMDATLDESVLFVGGIYGGFIFSDFLFASDGMFTIGKMLEMLAKTGLSPSQLDDHLPKRFIEMKEVTVPWEKKGTVMRKAMEFSDNKERQLVEGVKIFEDNNSVLLLPAKEKACFNVYAESSNSNSAKELAEQFVKHINTWKSE
jgi:mannose-1-phosphate guanylyltransferase/phosphomannomutase